MQRISYADAEQLRGHAVEICERCGSLIAPSEQRYLDGGLIVDSAHCVQWPPVAPRRSATEREAEQKRERAYWFEQWNA
jgi:hypothetical protein